MTEYETNPGVPVPEPKEPAGSNASDAPEQGREAWREVGEALDDLGKAVAAWSRSITDDPENRRRAEQLKDGLQQAGSEIGGAVDRTVRSDFVKEVGKAAANSGDILLDSARRVFDEVGPHIAGAVRSAAEGVRDAAERAEQRSKERTAYAPPPPPSGAPEAPPAPPESSGHPSAAPSPYCGEEPPAPAPSGAPDE